MAAESPASREERISALASQLVTYLRHGTDAELDDPGAVSDAHGPDALLDAVERLDLALAQLSDLATVYDDGARPPLDQLALPVAALTGEYLRHGGGAAWVERASPSASESRAAVRRLGRMGFLLTRAGVGGCAHRIPSGPACGNGFAWAGGRVSREKTRAAGPARPARRTGRPR